MTESTARAGASVRIRLGSSPARRLGAGLSAGLALTLTITLGSAVPARAADPKFTPGAAKPVPAVATQKVAARKSTPPPARPASARPAPVWPTAAATDLALPGAPGKAAQAKVGGLPVTVTAAAPQRSAAAPDAASRAAADPATRPEKVKVEVLDQAAAARAGVSGQLIKLARADGRPGRGEVALTVGYGGFATGFGGDWASRLRLVQLPECALTTPDQPYCQGTVLPTRNDAGKKEVSATVGVGATGAAQRSAAAAGGGATLLAVAAGPSGPAGSYAATSLNASSTWSAGGSSGDFSWTYGMRIPPAVGGPVPTVELTYSSQSVDGRMAASNNQPSEVGEGFDLTAAGFIERRYQSCAEDMKGGNNSTKTGDQCWATDNAVLNLGGRSVELIRDNADKNLWHPRRDDGSRVQRRFGASNGDNDGEWWVVTTVNGTQYWFGRNRLPGWNDDRPATQSTWTVPVFGNHKGEECHAEKFADSSCRQAWRWNLDYVVDPHRNTMSFWYSTQSNHYAKNLDIDSPGSYVRAGHLERVDYGTRVEPTVEGGTDTVFTGHGTARVVYDYADRCLSDCGKHDDKHWPDTPWDLNCGEKSCKNSSPTFWTTKRLSAVTTQVRGATAGGFRDVERWTFTHSFPDPEDTTRAGLWLDRVGHAGLVGSATSLPDITFHGDPMPNRVDAVDQAPAMNWRRLVAIETETGGLIGISYAKPDCVAGQRVPDKDHLENNTLRCYPVKWTREGYSTPKLDYFHKYVVDAVTETDLTGGAPRKVTRYEYLDDPAWHYTDDDGLIPDEAKTWSQWRGYARVATTVGDPGEQTYTEARYLRGMHGDHLPGGRERSVTVTDSQGGTVTDEDWYAGSLREQRILNGPKGAEVSGVINDPWHSAATATRKIGDVTVSARYVDVQAVHSRTARDGGRPQRRNTVRKTFDEYGMAVRVDDRGDDDVTGDEQCTITTYEPRNTTAWLLSYPHRAQSFATTCATAVAGPVTEAQVIGDGRTFYDGKGFGVAPTRGDTTQVEQLAAFNGGNPSYTTVSKSGYDSHGRVRESWDALNNRSATTYVPDTGGPVTQTVDTNPRGWTTTNTIEPAWGLATATTDVNGQRTDLEYDGFGRLTAVWLPDRKKGTHSANIEHDYRVRRDGAVAVTSRRLNPAGSYISSYALYDGLLRPRQTQGDSPSGGRTLTDTFYDTAGRAVRTFGTYHASGAPGIDLVKATDATTVPNQNRTIYDGAGRPTHAIFQPYAVERWRTSTTYGGDRIDVTPPAGGTAKSTFVDGRGRTVRLRTYHGDQLTGKYTDTTYQYNQRNLLEQVTDPAGNSWKYGYDLRGRQTTFDDPDRGRTETTYDNGGRIATTKDSRGKKLAFSYDNLSRRTGVYLNSLTGPRVAGWSYDSTPLPDGVTPAKGQLSSTTRYVGSDAYTMSVSGYTAAYQPAGSTLSVPLVERGLSGSYRYSTGYNPDGSVNSVTAPTTADMPLESVGYEYTPLGLPRRMTTFFGTQAQSSYVSDTRYNALAQAEQYTLYTGLFSSVGSRVYQSYVRELETGRLTRITTTRDGVNPNTVSDVQYSYDHAGKVTKVTDAPPGGATDVQCFDYDGREQLTEAWTPKSGDCAAARAADQLGGPAPYWQSWTYDDIGRRRTQVEHTSAGEIKSDYTYPTGTTQPHTLLGVTRTAGDTSVTTGYSYDPTGNTKTRPGPGSNNQTLTWDDEGRLAATEDPTGKTSYLYDADGNRLIRRDAKGSTLYLPGAELRWDIASNKRTCIRFYSFGGGPVAQRTAAGITWLTADRHGTQQVAIDEQTQAVTQRRETPYGLLRGAAVNWPNEKGFVGGTVDPTGLTHLGAREYDPAIGRFISADPVLELTEPAQMEGYSYAHNNPITHSDPSGLCIWANEWCNPAPSNGGGSNGGGSNGGGSNGGGSNGGGSNGGGSNGGGSNGGSNQGTSGGHGGGNGGGGSKAGGKKCAWYDALCKGKQAVTSTINWVDDHKATIAGVAAGVAVGVGCGIAIGWTGAGAVACGALAGAVGSAVTYAVETKVEHKGEFTWGGLAKNAAVGALVGAVTGGLGSVGGQALKAGVSSALARNGAKVALQAGGKAASQEARNIGSQLARRGASKAAAGQGGGGTGASCNSFVPGARVLMADGSRRAIAKVKVGDQVRATDVRTGRTTARAVTAKITGIGARNLVKVTVAAATTGGAKHRPTTIVATDHHPFWVPDLRRWVDATDLKRGQWLQAAAGTWVQVTAIHRSTQHAVVHNLSVDVDHTYHVVAGQLPVLVHNCGGLDAMSAAGKASAKNNKTAAGRSYQKHSDRDQLPKVPGSEVNSVGQDLLDDILTDPFSDFQRIGSGKLEGGTRVISNRIVSYVGDNGPMEKFVGAVFNKDGGFEYFGLFL